MEKEKVANGKGKGRNRVCWPSQTRRAKHAHEPSSTLSRSFNQPPPVWSKSLTNSSALSNLIQASLPFIFLAIISNMRNVILIKTYKERLLGCTLPQLISDDFINLGKVLKHPPKLLTTSQNTPWTFILASLLHKLCIIAESNHLLLWC